MNKLIYITLVDKTVLICVGEKSRVTQHVVFSLHKPSLYSILHIDYITIKFEKKIIKYMCLDLILNIKTGLDL